MNKQELIQIHQLLGELKQDYEDRGVEFDISKYNEEGVSPNSIHSSKNAHKNSIQMLTSEIAETVSEMPSETDSEEQVEAVA